MAILARPSNFTSARLWAAQATWCVLLFGLPLAGLAEEINLAWNLKAEDRFQVVREQQAVAHTSVASKPVRTSIETKVTMTWQVEALDDQGNATIVQTLNEILVEMDAGSGVLKYDSSVAIKPTGPVKTIADGVMPLVGESFTVTMSPRGEMTSLKPSDKLAKLFVGKMAEDAGGFSAQGIAKLLQQPLLLLPEKPVDAGDTWEVKRDLPSSLGLLQQTLTYKFAGVGEGDQAKTARIELGGTIAAPPGAADKPKLKSNELTGLAQFDIEAGRLVEMTAKQTLELTTIYANTPLSSKTETKVTTRLSRP